MSSKLKKWFYSFYVIGIILAIYINIRLSVSSEELLKINVEIFEYIATGGIVLLAMFFSLNFILDFSFKIFQYFRLSFFLAVLIVYIFMISAE